MTRVFGTLFGAMLLTGAWVESANAGLVYSSRVLANRADQVIAGEPSSGVDWQIEDGRVRIISLYGDSFLLTLRVEGLIIPVMEGPICIPFGTDTCFGFNPSPDLLARVVCHDEMGEPAVEATTHATTRFTPDGDGFLVDRIELPEPCFAPIVLIGGSVGPPPDFNSPSNWFGVSGF